MNRYFLNISDIEILINTDFELVLERQFEPFLIKKAKTDYTVNFAKTEKLNFLESGSPPIFEGDCYNVYKVNNYYLRSFFEAPFNMEPYALVKYDYQEKIIDIKYLKKGIGCIKNFSNAFFHIGIEGILMKENKFCLHASFINTQYGGILFSGPSGIGKSTQADLWCRYNDAKLINGDRPIIGNKFGIWNAWGSPYAGSSKCYVNESHPIYAVVILKQDKVCNIRKLTIEEAYKKIYSGLTVNSWNSEFCIKAFDFSVSLATDIPVYEFACTPDLNAVNFLKKVFGGIR